MNDGVDVLMVEDNPHDAVLTQRALRRRSLAGRIVHVQDGQEALDWLFSNGGSRPRLVLLDVKLPRVDGLGVLRAIRERESTRCIPVVMLTSSREEQDVMASYRLGANSYIVKPVDFETFMAAVSDAAHYWLALNQGPV